MKRFKAFSLVEVLAVLAIASTILIAVSGVTTRVFLGVRNDEFNDFAIGVAFQAIETLKSPSDVYIDSSTGIPVVGNNLDGVYSLNQIGDEYYLIRQNISEQEIEECNTGNKYEFTIDSDFEDIYNSPNTCLQLYINEVDYSVFGNSGSYYDLNLILIVELPNYVVKQEFKGFRSNEIKIN